MHKRRSHPKEWVEESLASKRNVVPLPSGAARPGSNKEMSVLPQRKDYSAYQFTNI